MTLLPLSAADRPGRVFEDQVKGLSFAVVTSGTSRFSVLLDEQLPNDSSRQGVILDLLAKQLSPDGLERSHYQANKVVVLGRGDSTYDFKFHFYQVEASSRQLYSRLECSNAASSAGAVAMLLGIVRPKMVGNLRAINMATRQHVEVHPPRGRWWHESWSVQFTDLHHLWTRLTTDTETFRVQHGDVTVSGDIFHHGNVFVLASVPPERADEVLVNNVAQLGDAYASRKGLPYSISKVLLYQIRNIRGVELECEATCFSEGQRHHSLPGSAAMAMGAFFTAKGFLALPRQERKAETRVHLHHPSGEMTAYTHLERKEKWEITATSFKTPVRLLMHGSLVS